MDRLEPIRFNYKEYTINYLKTKYSKFFDQSRMMSGATYFNEGKVTIISESDECLEAKVCGTVVYCVRVNFLKRGKIETFCDCPYYKETSHYCKHVYAALLASEMTKKREFVKGAYLKNIESLKDIIGKTESIKKEYMDKYPKCISFIDNTIRDMNNMLDGILVDADSAKDYVLSANTVRSFAKINVFTRDYNLVVDQIEDFMEESKKEEERRIKEEKERKFEETRKKLEEEIKRLEEKRKIKEEKKKIRRKKLQEFRKEYKEEKKRIEETKGNRITLGDILLGLFLTSGTSKKKKDDLFSYREEDFEEDVEDEDDYYHDDLD